MAEASTHQDLMRTHYSFERSQCDVARATLSAGVHPVSFLYIDRQKRPPDPLLTGLTFRLDSQANLPIPPQIESCGIPGLSTHALRRLPFEFLLPRGGMKLRVRITIVSRPPFWQVTLFSAELPQGSHPIRAATLTLASGDIVQVPFRQV